MPPNFDKDWQNNVWFAFSVGGSTHAVYNLVLSETFRIGDTKYNI